MQWINICSSELKRTVCSQDSWETRSKINGLPRGTHRPAEQATMNQKLASTTACWTGSTWTRARAYSGQTACRPGTGPRRTLFPAASTSPSTPSLLPYRASASSWPATSSPSTSSTGIRGLSFSSPLSTCMWCFYFSDAVTWTCWILWKQISFCEKSRRNSHYCQR